MRSLPDELMFLKNRKEIQKSTSESMAGKVCVVTGATSGVGLAALQRLAQGGAQLVMVCRNPEKAQGIRRDIESRYNVLVDIVTADFSRLDTVRTAALAIAQKYAKIDVLINSAGMHSTKKLYTEQGYEMVFCVNHLAPFLFTNLLQETMKQSAPSRILFVNSEGHRFNGLDPDDLNWKKRHYTGLRGYGASKSAQLLCVWELAEKLYGTGVTVNALHPGDVRTNIGSNNGWLYRFFLRHFTWHMLKEVSISANAIYYLAASPELRDVSARFFHLTVEEKPAKHALDRTTGKRIWEKSMAMTDFTER